MGVNDEAASTLLDILLQAAREVPGQTVVHVRGDGTEHAVTFAELRDDALRVAGGLLAAGVEPGTPLPLVADRGDSFQPMFWGALAAGAVPVPLAAEPRRVGPVWELLGRPPVMVDESTAAVATAVGGSYDHSDDNGSGSELNGSTRLLRLDRLRRGRPPRQLPRPASDDVAFLQFSSGSTGAPKGVELSHAAVLANLRQIRAAMAITSEDVIATWMPYFHDMGLIGTHLVPMAARLKQIRIEPLSFAKRPALWFEAASRHRATLLSAANFALGLAVRRVPASALADLDLSCVRLLLVGAEPISPRVWREFTARTAPAGLDPRAPLPVYGLAEATLAVTVPPLGETAAPLVLDRAALSRNRVVETEPGGHAVELMDLGRPVQGCEVRITADSGGPVGDRRVGHVEVRGPQLARGYHRAPEASAAAFGDDGWLRTGDLGFLRNRRLCVTGRHKDVVFVNGRTFHASDLESAVAATPGLPSGAVAVVGSTDPDGGGERVVAFVQWTRPDPTAAAPVLRTAAGRLREALGHDDVRVLPLPPAGFPRTTSGKLRRGELRARFEAGRYATVEGRWAGPSVTTGGGAAGAGVFASRRSSRPSSRSSSRSSSHQWSRRSPREVQESVRGIWAGALGLPVSAVGLQERFHVLVTGTDVADPVPASATADSTTAARPRDDRRADANEASVPLDQSPAPDLATDRTPTTSPSPSLSPSLSPSTSHTDLIRRLLADALHRSPHDIGVDEHFLGLGLDSLSAVDLARRLERELGRPLPATLFFEHRTIGELAAHLATVPPTSSPTPTGPDDGNIAPLAPLPLTALQLAFHATESLHEGVTAYGYVRQSVTGPLDTALLGRALARLAARHAMLRMRITGDARPRQYAAPAGPIDTPPCWYEVREPLDIARLEQVLCNRPFDLRTQDPVRAVLVHDGDDAHVAHLLLVVHHAAADGFSLKLLCEELWSLYTALTREDEARPDSAGQDEHTTADDGDQDTSLSASPAEFADYVAALTAERRSPQFAQDQRYWRERLAEHTPTTPTTAPSLPYDGDPAGAPTPPLVHHTTGIDEALSAALRETAARNGVSLFHLLLAVYGRCLARWSGRRAVAVNVARARRESRMPGIDRLVGPLADTLPVFVDVDPEEPVGRLAERLRLIWREAEAHATLSSTDFARLLSALRPATGPAPRTAAEAGFSFARFPVVHGPDWPVTVTPTAAATASAATRLSLLCWEADAALRLSWNHPARLFRPETVRRLADEYVAELRATVAEPSPTPVGPGHHARTPARALGHADGEDPTAGALLGDVGGIVARLCARFRATPRSVAVAGADRSTLTYGALDTASAALAARLRAHGVGSGDLVGLLTEPGGTDTVIAVVGILRAGAGWVPLDATHPTARHRDQLARTGVRVLVCDTASRPAVAALDGITAVAASDPLDEGPVAEPEHRTTDPEAIAYVIFTSGSTGRPKAVPVTHRSMTNYLDWALATFGYGPGDRLAQTASVCFDASVRQLLAPLLSGATVHTLSRDLLRDPEALLDHVVADRITVWSSVPTLWERLLTAAEERVRRTGTAPDLSALRWVHVGGEALPAAYVRRWFDLLDAPGDKPRTPPRISNLYGPTEATINATCHIIDARPADDVRHLPIGRPVAGTELMVVDEDGRACGPGEAGELLIAGTGLTPGYVGEPRLTAAAFTERDGHRWYRSGDRVRRGADGVLEFLGRLDDQVKVRGHRVELGEVEAALLTHPGVARAAVLLRDGRLVAYAEPRTAAHTLDPGEVRGFLAHTLPPYMLPARIHSFPALPLTGTGKIDRTRLASPGGTADTESEHTEAARAPVSTPTERLLAKAWSELLDVPQSGISRQDDFFALGGDSITVLELFSRLRHERPALPRPTAVYTHSTLSALATAIDAAASSEVASEVASDIGAAAVAEPTALLGSERGAAADLFTPYPLTPSQQGFLLADALASGTPGSTDPSGASSGNPAWSARFRIRGPLDPDMFQRAVDVLVARHPMLRTVFPAGARPPVQQELPASLRLPVRTETLSHPALLEQRVVEETSRRFEPWAWPLLRLHLSTVAPDEHVLLVHAHHLIGDGFSAALLTRELLTVYGRFTRGLPHGLEPLRSTFRDHVLHRTAQRRPVTPPTPDPRTEAYRTRHHTPYTAPVLRALRPEDAVPGFHTAGFTLGADRTRALRGLARSCGTTLHAPVLTAYFRALAALTGRRDLVLGMAVTGRDDTTQDAHRVFGPFSEAVALRPGLDPVPSPDPGFEEDLRRVAAESIAARAAGPLDLRTPQGLPRIAQFFFTFLDFTALGTLPDTALTLRPDDADTELAPPPVGTDVFLAVRPSDDGEGLRVTARGSATALTSAQLDAFAKELQGQLTQHVPREWIFTPSSCAAALDGTLDAALIGYLPAPHHLAAFAGLPAHAAPSREGIRTLLFPDGRARLLEHLSTPLGRSGFVSLPLFADELTGPLRTGDPTTLAGLTARAVDHAASLGARCVSLAGMIPSLTGYGFDVVRERPVAGTTLTPVSLTTGHATTTVAVVRTVHTALAATGRDLGELTLAVVGCGSIGTSSLRLLLARSPRPPARLLLCDLPGTAPRLHGLAAELSADHPLTPVRVVEADGARTLPAEIYEAADVVVAAVSGGTTTLLDVDRLRPGTIVVDDSFPHCFDTARALRRMREAGDVLILGGGLLALDATETHLAPDLPAAALTGHAATGTQHHPALHLPGTLASCRLESLLHAHLTGRPAGTRLPLVHGLVDLPRALAHWDAAEAVGVRPAPLHLLDHTVPSEALSALPPPQSPR
ncbi:amino acid adenylation domain-containing protein [Streptomyces pseudovenezuelae]|uniref:amino acid adenylation domain-containing protein n=1 Tax=Streptomyces pseudovenezuelae TaxID=67350 RepID=UPI0036E689FD